jgi:molybdate transport system ATP-binding protein
MPVVLVTHDLQEALMLADRITLLSQGRTLQSGEPKKVLSRPVSEDAAMLLGLRNIFESVVVEQDSANAVTALDLAGHRIEIAYQPHLRQGDRISWVVADAGIRFRAISRKEMAPQKNRLRVTVVKMLTLGDQVRLFLQLADVGPVFKIDVTSRLAEELALAVSIETEVVLRAGDIHVFEQQVSVTGS